MAYPAQCVPSIETAKENIRGDLASPDAFHYATPDHLRDLTEAYFTHPSLVDAVTQYDAQLVLPTVSTLITKSEHVLFSYSRREVTMESPGGMVGLSVVEGAIYRRHRLTPPLVARLGSLAFNQVPVAEGSIMTVTTPRDAARISLWRENPPTRHFAQLMLQLPTAPTVFNCTVHELQPAR